MMGGYASGCCSFESGNETVNEVATDLFNAAQLAVFDVNRPEITLIVKPTNGTKRGR